MKSHFCWKLHEMSRFEMKTHVCQPSAQWSGGHFTKNIFCYGLHDMFRSLQKVMFVYPTHGVGWGNIDTFQKYVIGRMEGWQASHLYISINFIQFLAKEHFRSLPPPHKMGVVNITFLCRSGYFI